MIQGKYMFATITVWCNTRPNQQNQGNWKPSQDPWSRAQKNISCQWNIIYSLIRVQIFEALAAMTTVLGQQNWWGFAPSYFALSGVLLQENPKCFEICTRMILTSQIWSRNLWLFFSCNFCIHICNCLSKKGLCLWPLHLPINHTQNHRSNQSLSKTKKVKCTIWHCLENTIAWEKCEL